MVLVKIIIILGVILLVVAYLTYLERKVIAHLQVRIGPMRVGWHGLLQPIADGLKLLVKEDIIPEKADKWVFILSPIICLVPAFVVYAVIPFSQHFYLANINIGILYIISISALGVYGIVLAGWSSNSKYALLGGFRSAAQMISYEIFLGFSIIGPLMLAGSLNTLKIVEAQSGVWFIIYQPLAFALYLIAGIAETNRIPFDLPEAETELVAGFHTEYSGMKFAFFFLAEYANMMVVSSMAVILFLGGWKGPFLPGIVWFAIKVGAFLFLFIWLRGTLPRYRYDQLMRIGWKIMFPLCLLNIALTGIIYYLFL
ncbi:MAG: NADH-quinone oxidoreductase subunit H [Nitrospinae bacterium RIFCSPLOWO2_12_FULL_45_22]|nr:MAG: NADH-quinone oxidoreductase subunit H [Nitrospinae bacterium RIFCSPLOWO2_12_FULL_45_22]